jgi:3-oxoacyl-[acyl-carrier-protein] synthase-3
MNHSHIIGTGSAIPERILSNKDLEAIVDTTNEWIVRRSGIRERRIASNKREESTTHLATKASVRALEMANISPENLDMIIVGTVTSDRQFPSTACMIQEAMNAGNAAAFDVSAGCSGFLYALTVADNAISCGTCKTALVVGVERLSSVINWQDRGTCVLLADGAGAVVLSAKPTRGGILSSHLKSDGKLWEFLHSADGNSFVPATLKDVAKQPFHLKMKGNPLFKRAINCMTQIAGEALIHNNLSTKDISLVVPHQANMRIIEALAKNIEIPMEKVYTNIQKYGNTSSATIPIALDEANREGRLMKGAHVLLVSFGAGLTWAASVLQWTL